MDANVGLGTGVPDAPSDAAVRFVRLRPRVVPEPPEDDGDGHRSVAWKVQWMVRAHRRAQWYPKRQEHRVIWIAPYIKGPADAPFKAPVYRVDR